METMETAAGLSSFCSSAVADLAETKAATTLAAADPETMTAAANHLTLTY